MTTSRKLEALRALAERPGTEAEGRLAREILKRLKGRGTPPEDDLDFDAILSAWVRGTASPIPTRWTCSCGTELPVGYRCHNTIGHDHIQNLIREKFKKGDFVYYNHWAYSVNCRGVVKALLEAEECRAESS